VLGQHRPQLRMVSPSGEHSRLSTAVMCVYDLDSDSD